MDAFFQDLRYAYRQLGKNLGFATVAVLTLALGIGANLAVFSVTNAVLLNPSGAPDPGRLVALRARYQMGDLANIGMSAPDFADAASGKDLVTAAAAMRPGSFNYLPGSGLPERLQAALVSWQWFDVFLARPRLGRVFRPEEDLPAANHQLVLSHSAWKHRFGGDPSIVGRKLMLNGQPYEVIGVMDANFAWPNQAEVWAPLATDPAHFHDHKFRYNENLFAVARMREGVTLEQINRFLFSKTQENVAAEGTDSYGRASGWGMFAMPLIDLVSGKLRTPLAILLAAVALVLLVACANIAGLQLARATGRRREVSIEIALGAGRGRLIQHALVENLLLAGGGGVLGFVLARLTVPLLLLIAPSSLAGNIPVRMDTTVLVFGVVAGALCALLCGLAPAWHMTRVGWFHALKESGRGETSSQARLRLRSALVVAQIATAMLLMVGAGLLVRSLEKVETVQTGFDPQHLTTAVVTLSRSKYNTEESWAAFTSALEDQLRARPGIRDVGIADSLPFDGMGGAAGFMIVGRPMGPNDPGAHGNIRVISPAYFSTLHIPLLRGRVFSETDRKGTQPVTIIDDVLARQYWPGQDPVGQRIAFDPKAPPITIVGLVKHARSSSLEDDGSEGCYFLPIAQNPSLQFSFAVRGSGAYGGLVADMQAAVRAVDPDQPIYDIKTMSERVDDSLLGRRFLVVLLSVFAGLALLLSALGLYGIVNYSVKLRFRELGIRLALGAQRRDVLRLILSQGIRLALVGIPIGVAGVVIAGRALSSVLYQISPLNPLTLLMTSLILAATVLAASYWPAQRSAAIDPMQSLREE